MTADLFSRVFLAVFFTGVAGFYTVSIAVKKRKLGYSPVSRGAPGSRARAIHSTFAVFRAAIWLICLIRVPLPQIDRYLIPLTWLWHAPILIAGNLLLAVAFTMILLIHRFEGSRWRSGVDETGPEGLLTTGPFALVRNPIFVCIQLAQLGLFLSMPTLFTLVCLAVGVVTLHQQARIEEQHLTVRFGDAYRNYASRTGRWLPFRRPTKPNR